MSVRRDRTHHRPRVYRMPGARSKWSFPWRASCDCGYRAHEMTHHGAFIDALTHSMTLR